MIEAVETFFLGNWYWLRVWNAESCFYAAGGIWRNARCHEKSLFYVYVSFCILCTFMERNSEWNERKK